MDITVARIVHFLSVVLWIGGVAFVTTVLFPAVRRAHAPEDRLAAFLRFEQAFSWQARISVALAGLSGLYMAAKQDAWSRFATPEGWWLDAMAALWLAFALMLFVFEPLVLHRLEQAATGAAASGRFDRMERFHRVALALSLIVILGAVGGAHGLF